MSSKAGGRKKKAGSTDKVLADNRRARYNYAVEDTVEAGIMLVGTEVKALILLRVMSLLRIMKPG